MTGVSTKGCAGAIRATSATTPPTTGWWPGGRCGAIRVDGTWGFLQGLPGCEHLLGGALRPAPGAGLGPYFSWCLIGQAGFHGEGLERLVGARTRAPRVIGS